MYMRACVCTRVRSCVYACVYTYVYICDSARVRAYMRAYVYTRVTYVRACARTCEREYVAVLADYYLRPKCRAATNYTLQSKFYLRTTGRFREPLAFIYGKSWQCPGNNHDSPFCGPAVVRFLMPNLS